MLRSVKLLSNQCLGTGSVLTLHMSGYGVSSHIAQKALAFYRVNLSILVFVPITWNDVPVMFYYPVSSKFIENQGV